MVFNTFSVFFSSGAVWAAWWALLTLFCVSVWFLGPAGIGVTLARELLAGAGFTARLIEDIPVRFEAESLDAYIAEARETAGNPGRQRRDLVLGECRHPVGSHTVQLDVIVDGQPLVVVFSPDVAEHTRRTEFPAGAVTSALLIFALVMPRHAHAQHVETGQDPRLQLTSPESREVAHKLGAEPIGCAAVVADCGSGLASDLAVVTPMRECS